MRYFVLTLALATLPATAFASPACTQRDTLPTVTALPSELQIPAILDGAGVHGQAQVIVRLIPEAKHPQDVRLFASSGSEMLDLAAIRAAKATQFDPETRDCVAVAGEYIYTFVY